LEGRFNLQPDAIRFFSAYIDCMTDIRVMIVDDVERVRQDLCTLLTLAGDFEVVGQARNGREAIQQARALQPDVILMDLEMPDLDGYEAARQIKAHAPACRLVALTVHGSEAAQQKAFQAGMDDFVVKGAPLETLVHALSQGMK
jgi:DNA-binding NarL/FixJ family response regulator